MIGNVAVPARETDGVTEIKALAAALTELSSRAGHDMVGPLNQAASLLALFIKRYQDKLDGDADQLLGFLQSASGRMEGLVTGLRDYMEAVGRLPSYSAVDLDKCLASALGRLQKEISDTGATIEAGTLPAARADQAQVSMVFEQLINNAMKFRNAGEPAHIRISGTREGQIVKIAIADDCMGIEPEQSEAIFLPFKRLNGREYPGAGLGLAAVKAIVTMHGGTIRLVPSDPGQAGNVIEFTLRAL